MKRWLVEPEKIYLPSEVPLGVGLDGIATLSMGISPGSKGEALLLSKETTASSVNPCNSSTLKMETNK